MILKSIEIQGFKSFADKTVFNFGQGVTAVVGPNGSGKSNITDAVRWVLGEQSTKSLRGQSMEDVIFNGTNARRAHGFAEVTLIIDNCDRSLKFDNDNIAITRRYYRSHEGEFLINNAVVRLKDIHELFMDTGIGRDGYSMIGQGKIDSIVSSKSQERRDIFEEASGISRYRYKKIESERRLAQSEDNLVRLRDIIGELEGRVGPLKDQSAKAQRFLELAADKKKLEIGLWLHSLARSGDALSEHENKVSLSAAQYEQMENEMLEIVSEIEHTAEEFSNSSVLIDEVRRQTAALEERITRKDGEIALIRNTIDHNNESIDRIHQNVNELEGSDSFAAKEIESKTQAILKKETELISLNERSVELSGELAGLISDSEGVSRKIEVLTRSLNTLSTEGSQQRVIIVTAESSMAEIGARLNAIEATIVNKTLERNKNDIELNELQKDLENANEIISECENSLKGYEMRYNTRKEKVNSMKNDLDGLRLDIEETKRRISILQDLEKNMEGFNLSVKTVMNEVSAGNLRGILGPVSRLVNVPAEYALAIEVALAAAAQNIAVETENDAKRAIALLKSANKGRATFLPITSIKMRVLDEKGLDACYGFVGIASDLVSCDDKYKSVISSLLARTVIADDLDAAVAIAKKYGYRFKIVSLDGQVVNAGGSLTGGSMLKNAGLLSRAGDIKNLNLDIAKLIEKQEDFKKIFELATLQLTEVEADILAAQSERTTANEDKIRLVGEIRRISELCAACNADIAVMATEQKANNERITALKTTIADASMEFNRIDAEKIAAQSEIDNVSGGRDNMSGKRDELSFELTNVKLRSIEVSKDIEAAKEAVALLESSISNRGNKTCQFKIEIEELVLQNSQLQNDIHILLADIESIRLRINESESNVKRLMEKRDAADRQAGELRQKEREISALRERLSGETARLEERKESMLREYDEIIKKMYDEYELTRTEAEAIGVPIEKPTEAKKELTEIKTKIKSLGNVNVSAIEEYIEVSQRYEFMSEQINDIEISKKELLKLIDQLTIQMKELFVEGFEKINLNFKTTFSELFGGGMAQLVLIDPDNVLESGIDIHAKLPGKNVPNLDGLSGGEKALVAISIYFAIMRSNPPPFCFLDEVDTALDDINVDRFAEYMRNSNFNTQFVCVTHRRGTMESADMLYGVTMQEKGVSKLLALNVDQLIKTLNIENAG